MTSYDPFLVTPSGKPSSHSRPFASIRGYDSVPSCSSIDSWCPSALLCGTKKMYGLLRLIAALYGQKMGKPASSLRFRVFPSLWQSWASSHSRPFAGTILFPPRSFAGPKKCTAYYGLLRPCTAKKCENLLPVCAFVSFPLCGNRGRVHIRVHSRVRVRSLLFKNPPFAFLAFFADCEFPLFSSPFSTNRSNYN